MSVECEFSFRVDDKFDEGRFEEATVSFDDDFIRFRIVCWGGTVLALPYHDDLEESGVLLPFEYRKRPAWVAKFRSKKKQTNVWARLLLDPTPLAIWLGALRMRVSNQVTERLCIVTDDEYGVEMGRAEGRFV